MSQPEFERRADPVGDVQRAALVRHLHPFDRAAVLLEEAEGYLYLGLWDDTRERMEAEVREKALLSRRNWA